MNLKNLNKKEFKEKDISILGFKSFKNFKILQSFAFLHYINKNYVSI